MWFTNLFTIDYLDSRDLKAIYTTTGDLATGRDSTRVLISEILIFHLKTTWDLKFKFHTYINNNNALWHSSAADNFLFSIWNFEMN